MSNSLASTILRGAGETLYMVSISTAIALVLGFIIAIILIYTRKDGFRPNKVVYGIINFVVNIIRSYPFIILVVAIIPFTRLIVNTSIGVNAAIVPLTIGTAPFVARIIENALVEVDKGLIEAAKSFGATNLQIVFKVMIVEAMPSIISGITLTVITVIGYSAMAGAVGAGGLGAVAIMYGYNMFDEKTLMVAVIALVIIVQLIQWIGNMIYKRVK